MTLYLQRNPFPREEGFNLMGAPCTRVAFNGATGKPLDIDGLDPGIAPFVEILWTTGIDTYESCEGGPGHSYPEPAIRFDGGRGEGFRALAAAVAHDLPVRALRRFWSVDRSGEPTGPYWEMSFREVASPASRIRCTACDHPSPECDVPA